MTTATQQQPKYFRAHAAHGLETVNRDAGRFGFGVIHGVSVITRGEALGHDLWVDHDFLSDVTGAINAASDGVKARFTHPGLSSDGVGQKLGKLTDATMIGDQVFADLHLQEAATKTPDGDLADYVLTLAEETPEDFGLSIVFEHNFELMQQHIDDNSVEHAGRSIFTSPDELNKNNYPHARLSRLRAGDVVDSPAANPAGLFQRGQDAAAEGEQLLQYVLGLSDVKPGSSMFDVDGDRAKQFLERFLSRHELSITKGGGSVSQDATPEPVVEAPPAPTRDDFSAELKRYVDSFGAENGTEWFTAGLDFAEAQGKHIEQQGKQIALLQAKIEELEETLRSLDRGEEDGGEFAGEETPVKTFAGKIRITGKQYANN